MNEKFSIWPRAVLKISRLLLVNPVNSQAMSALTFLLFKLNTLQAKIVKLLSQLKPWCNDSGVLNLHHG